MTSDSGPSSIHAAPRQPLWQRQFDFAAAILDPELPPPSGLVGPDGEPSARRFAVYRNNVVVGLCETLKASFPAVLRLVGEDFFFAMARNYVAGEQPPTPMMFDYGARFPRFIDSFPPAKELPYLGDVARVERAWVEAYHAAEARPLEPIVFRTIPADALPELRLTLHPSLRLLRSTFPVLTIWRANIADDPQGTIYLDAGGEDGLFLRPEAEVEVRALPVGGYEFVAALAEGHSIVAGLEAALEVEPRFDLSSTLFWLIGSGAVIGLGSTSS